MRLRRVMNTIGLLCLNNGNKGNQIGMPQQQQYSYVGAIPCGCPLNYARSLMPINRFF